jgi:NAD(P)H-hydrate epimerase
VVIGGGPYSGAPALAALASLRAGAERATVIAPRPAADRVQGFSPDLVVRGTGEEHFRRRDVPSIRELLRQTPPKALVIGMGAGSDPETVGALGEVLEWAMGRFPLVVDADALLALDLKTRSAEDRSAAELVATPNDGEYSRLFVGGPTPGVEDRAAQARSIAKTNHLTLLVKGDVDLITDGDELYRNRHHHPAMTVGGLGDVLAGVVGALLAQGVPPVHAARLGSYWAGEAGTRVAEVNGFGLVASDVIAQLAPTLVDGIRRARAGR